MHCPKCGQKLSPEKCGEVEIDVCPSCKGVWLDQGELGTIIQNADTFFHKCFRLLRGHANKSPHMQPKNSSNAD